MKKILLVEDDDFLSSLLVKKFAQHGVEVERFASGQTALDALHAEALPALMLLDLYLPDVNGFEVLEVVRKDEKMKDLRVIVISNTAQAADKARVEALGASFITKALVTPEDIVRMVQETLAKA